jgi:hypothetical protein
MYTVSIGGEVAAAHADVIHKNAAAIAAAGNTILKYGIDSNMYGRSVTVVLKCVNATSQRSVLRFPPKSFRETAKSAYLSKMISDDRRTETTYQTAARVSCQLSIFLHKAALRGLM